MKVHSNENSVQHNTDYGRHPKYAPANDVGEKPYIVVEWNFGREREILVYANDVATAKYRAVGRRAPGRYAKGCRRALWSEVQHNGGENAIERN